MRSLRRSQPRIGLRRCSQRVVAVEGRWSHLAFVATTPEVRPAQHPPRMATSLSSCSWRPSRARWHRGFVRSVGRSSSSASSCSALASSRTASYLSPSSMGTWAPPGRSQRWTNGELVRAVALVALLVVVARAADTVHARSSRCDRRKPAQRARRTSPTRRRGALPRSSVRSQRWKPTSMRRCASAPS